MTGARIAALILLAIAAAYLALLTMSCGSPASRGTERHLTDRQSESMLRADLHEAMVRDGVTADLLHQIAASHWRSGKVDSSRRYLERAVLLEPRHVPSLTWLSRLHYESGDYAAGIALLDPVVHADPDIDPEVLANLSVLRLAWGDSTGAESLLRRCAARHPRYAPARGNLGFLYLQQGVLARAAAELRAAIELDGTVPEFHNNLGIVYRKSGDLERSVAAFERAIALDPTFIEAHHNLALLFKLYLEDDARARRHYRNYIALGGHPREEMVALFQPPPLTP